LGLLKQPINFITMGLFDFFSKEKKESLDKGLEKTKDTFFSKLGKAVVGKSKVDDEVLDELEEILITSDVGINTTLKIIRAIEERVEREKYLNTAELDTILREEVLRLLAANPDDEKGKFTVPKQDLPYVILVVGVNGVGKTTTIGKLAAQFTKAGKKVVLGAADTFRAAAVDQLILWGERTGVPVISHGMNTDPASVAHDAVKEAVDRKADVVLIDTAGRLHNKVNLMNELSKIKRVIQRFIPEAPHEVMLVLDGSTGQNAVMQAKEFTKATEVSSMAVTKLDGTAKGGVVIGISDEFNIPIRYIGVGEKIDDLQVFNKYEFVDSLFKR
jgi:fused signal recognition particle receptor